MTYESYLKEISKIPLLKKEEEKQLAVVMKHDSEAKHKFFASNLRLVISIAKKYSKNGNLLDLIQEGNIGLMTAVDKFENSKGYKFSTYGTIWIKSKIVYYLQSSQINSLPLKLRELRRKCDRIRNEYFAKHEKEPSNQYLSKISKDYLGKSYTAEEIREFKQIIYEFKGVSLEDKIKPGSEIDKSYFIGDCIEQEILENLSGQSLFKIVNDHIDNMQLTARNRHILYEKLVEDQDYNTIAQELNMTESTVKSHYFKLHRMFMGDFRKSKVYMELKQEKEKK
ncbi:MAG: sigma-70 family RNA polymerase sigma factor [Nanoarchaeota archaeon]|nr:sigma-70 family RNA polymerase sigma factor [Nanoarchaeota archaeon]